MKYLTRLFMIIFLNFILYAQSATNESKEGNIVIKLDSKAEIQQAMDEIKVVNLKDFNYLEQLRSSNDPQFKSKLHNSFYALKQKQKMELTIPKRELGYYEKVKESEKRVEYILSLYAKITKPEERNQWEKRLQEAAEQRYLIEVEMKQSQIKNLENRIGIDKKSLSDFEAHKKKYISSFISKTKAHLNK